MNTFGTATKQIALYDPRSVRENRTRFRRDYIPLLERANSIYVPTGREPTRGLILVSRRDYNYILSANPYSNALQLNVGDPTQTNNVGTLKNLSIVQAQCVTRGLASDVNALYLVELTDGRGVLHNKWFQFPITTQYNIRAPAYPQLYNVNSLNSGSVWTWTTMLQNIWTQMATFLGAWPGLPYAPLGTPEGFWFNGVPAWTALCGVLEHLGMTVACNLTSSSPFIIVDDGADDTAFTALQTKYRTHLEDDLEWIDTGSGRVPGTVKVLFRRRNSIYGSEETVTRTSDDVTGWQWDMDSTYSVSVAAPATFTGATGTHHMWSDFTVRYDMDNVPIAADVATANAIAAERTTQYFDRIYSRTSGWMTQTYAGALPFVTGSQVDGVCYYQDFIDQDRQGWKTKIVRGEFIPSGKVRA